MFYILQPLFLLDFSPMDLEHALKRPEFFKLQQMSQKYSTATLTPSGVKYIMQTHPQDVAAIVPEGFLVVNWEAFQPMASNWDLITKDSIVHVTIGTDGGLLAFSFATSLEVKVGLYYRADYYVHPQYANDNELMMSHIIRLLSHIHQFYRGNNVSFSILYPQNVARVASTVKEMLNTNLGLRMHRTPEAPCLLLKSKLKPDSQL